ncbi:transmembrane protein [Mycobacterium tuberculosis]|nr:transmembrane protein [Mycobacterium tuberculosis]
MLLRDIAVMVLCGLVVWQIYRPGRDLVRTGGPGALPACGGVDDPVGGVFANAADAPPGRLPSWLRPRLGDEHARERTPDAGRDRTFSGQHRA